MNIVNYLLDLLFSCAFPRDYNVSRLRDYVRVNVCKVAPEYVLDWSMEYYCIFLLMLSKLDHSSLIAMYYILMFHYMNIELQYVVLFLGIFCDFDQECAIGISSCKLHMRLF